MKCFQHTERDAVGLCKNCSKALCPECAADLGRGLACKGRCEHDVAELNRMLDHNIQLVDDSSGLLESQLKMQRRSAGFAAWLLLVAGAVLFGWGWMGEGGLNFVTAIGLAFLAFGGIGLFGVSKMPRTPAQDTGARKLEQSATSGHSRGEAQDESEREP